jgi:hypothetical protein
MKLDHVGEVLSKHIGAKRDGATFLIPVESEVTMFVALTGETLAVPKVIRVEIAEPMIICDTSRGDRVVFYADDVRAIRSEKGEGGRRERSAGFR